MKQKVKWVGKLPPVTTGRPMADDLARVLDALRASPGKWAAIGANEDQGNHRKVYNRYYRYRSALKNRNMTDFEFMVRNRVLYGRFVGDDA